MQTIHNKILLKMSKKRNYSLKDDADAKCESVELIDHTEGWKKHNVDYNEAERLCKMHSNQPSPGHRIDEDTTGRVNSQDHHERHSRSPTPSPSATLTQKPKIENSQTVASGGALMQTATINGHRSSTDSTAICQQRLHSNSRDSNGGTAAIVNETYKRSSTATATASAGKDDDEEIDVIGVLIGDFGKWQFLMTMLLSLFQVPNTFHISSSIYQAANKEFWCRRPVHLQQVPVTIWRNISNSNDNCFQSSVDWTIISYTNIMEQFMQPQMLSTSSASSLSSPSPSPSQSPSVSSAHLTTSSSLSSSSLSPSLTPSSSSLSSSSALTWPIDILLNNSGSSSSSISNLVACTAWEYEMNDNLGNSWISQWDLVCDKEYLKNVAEMFFLLGVATGGIISGYLSDKFGRKTMLFISAVLQTIFGLALYFAYSFEFYITLRALLGLVSVSVTYSGLILAIEYVDGKWRTIAGMYNLFPLPISYMVISGIAYLTQDYQTLQLCIGIPGIFLCLLWFVVPESPRWLLVKGRIDEVKVIIEAAANYNKRELPTNYESMLKPPTQEVSSQSFLCLFRSSYLRRITICFLCIWFTMNLSYYGFILNMSTFGGNVYLNSALAGLVEIPAIAIAMYIISKVGKKWLFSATLVFAGIACLSAAIIEGRQDMLGVKITFIMIGKFTISAGNTIMPVYTAELYPTAIRNVGVGACNVAAGFALILTPYLSLLNKIEGHLLMTLLTACCLFGGFVVLFLPETMKQHKKVKPIEEKC